MECTATKTDLIMECTATKTDFYYANRSVLFHTPKPKRTLLWNTYADLGAKTASSSACVGQRRTETCGVCSCTPRECIITCDPCMLGIMCFAFLSRHVLSMPVVSGDRRGVGYRISLKRSRHERFCCCCFWGGRGDCTYGRHLCLFGRTFFYFIFSVLL